MKKLKDLFEKLYLRYLLGKGRYIDVLIRAGRGSRTYATEHRAALYKLGCYHSLVAMEIPERSFRDAIASAVSKAATGDIAGASSYFRAFIQNRRLSAKERAAAASALAPYDPELALTLCDGLPSRHNGLLAALLIAFGRSEEARAILHRDLDAGRARAVRDLFLLLANTGDAGFRPLDMLNRHFAHQGLTGVTAIDAGAPLSVANVKGEAAAGTVTGPLVSIIMPSFNTRDRIVPAIRSLLVQTYANLEILVVDDCSEDGTPDVVEAAFAGEPKVHLYRSTNNGGPYVARNFALSRAAGEFVTCHDSDDWAHPEKIARQVRPLLADRALVFTISDWVRLSDDGEFYARQIYPLSRLNPASPLFRRDEVLTRIGGWQEERFGADGEFLLRLKTIYGPRRWAHLRQTLALGAHRPGSLMTDARTGLIRGGQNPTRLAYTERQVAALVAEAPPQFDANRHRE